MKSSTSTPWYAWDEATWAPTRAEVTQCAPGLPVPSVALASTLGGALDVAALALKGAVVVYCFPGTDTRRERPQDPDGLLGTGCTVQSRVYRELAPRFAARGTKIVGVSSQEPGEQRRFARREQLPFPLLSDGAMELADALELPTTLGADGRRLYPRMSFLAVDGEIEQVFDTVPIPRRNAIDVLAWMAEQETYL